MLVFTGWLGSGKSHAARLLAAAFPVQANVHTLGLYRKVDFSFLAVFRIHRIHVFLGLPDPNPDPLVRGMDPDPDPALDPDPSIIKQKSKKNLDFYCFVTSF